MSSIEVRQGQPRRVLEAPGFFRAVGRGPRLEAGLISFPKSHLLVKAPGERVDISWEITNTGDQPGISRLWLYALGNGGLVLEGPAVHIPPGATVPLFVSWPNNLPAGTNDMLVIMANQSPGATDSVADHQFAVSVVSPVNMTVLANDIFILKPGGFYTWTATVRNDEPIGGRIGFFRMARTSLSSFGGPHPRILTGSHIGPGETEKDTANVSTGATFERGELWVEEWTDLASAGGVFVRELPGSRKPYSMNF